MRTETLDLRWQPPPVYFMHIPKTAGKSLSHMLRLAYCRRDIIAIKGPRALQRLTLTELKQYRCYLCHFGPGLFDLVGRSDLVCVTFLREPVEWAISRIYFHQERVNAAPEGFTEVHRNAWLPLAHADLPTLLRSPFVQKMICDGQTRHLGTTLDLRPFLRVGDIGSRNEPLRMPIAANATHKTANITEIAALARQRLESMALVGITEKYAQSVALISDLLGIPTHTDPAWANLGPQKQSVAVHGYRATLPPAIIEQVESLTQYDRELYAYATALWEQSLMHYQARTHRSYSIAARLHTPVNRIIDVAATWGRGHAAWLMAYLRRK